MSTDLSMPRADLGGSGEYVRLCFDVLWRVDIKRGGSGDGYLSVYGTYRISLNM
jgi:hypothetical protein